MPLLCPLHSLTLLNQAILIFSGYPVCSCDNVEPLPDSSYAFVRFVCT